MPHAGVPAVIYFSCLLNECAMDNKMHLAMQIFDGMVSQYDTRPDVVTFNTMIKGFGRNKQNGRMMEMLERMKQHGNM